MEEIVTYIGQGLGDDKHGENAIGHSGSVHSSTFSYAYKFANAHPHGAVSTGFMNSHDNDKVFVAVKNKALIHVYAHGKEAPIQKIPVPEQLTSLAFSKHHGKSFNDNIDEFADYINNGLQLPWLLVGGSISGKLYVWELNSGNLLFNRSVHYQKMNKIEFSNNNNLLVTSSDDSRVLVFRTLDLVSSNTLSNNGPSTVKPIYAIMDHSLPVTDFHITSGLNSDLKLVTASRDATCRVYDLKSLKILFTLVLYYAIHSLTIDPALRSVYLGLENGAIREVKLYQIDSNTRKLYHIAEKTNNKIITLEDDPDLKHSFIMHQQTEQSQLTSSNVRVTCLDVSLDGTLLISGDSLGKVIISDIVTKQTIKSLKPVNGAVSYLQSFVALSKDQNNNVNLLGTKKGNHSYRTVPQLKRSLVDSLDVKTHELLFQIPENDYHNSLLSNNHKLNYDFDQYLTEVAQQEQLFKSGAFVAGKATKEDGNKDEEIKQLQEKLLKMTNAYSQLRSIHEELFEEHTKLLNNKE